ncbi:Aste57867_21647 [Aphanomyces stellatus]|uniref:Aste57867_21647 protein n=1 Tax=Aphanomyces stellatus TaxID=120398 RepID=A0A485LK54_9STRA|nr:hypothetical protein As57867_021578 [Aphanomyces stellatus]VFT98316.1 Aste57867_21647 [Aphanomyces stellatus]
MENSSSAENTSAGSDEFKGYDYSSLKRIHADLIRRQSRRGVKSIRNPRGYFLLATRFAKKEPLPLHLVAKGPNLTNAIASNVQGYIDPNIQTYLRNTWWPMAHFNPIGFKKNKDLELTKDDYVRFNCKVYRSLLPDITYAEAIRRIDRDWRDDIFLDNDLADGTRSVIDNDDDDNEGETTTIVAPSVADKTMDFALFCVSVLDLATSCTAGGMDALYLFLQSLRVKMKTVREFDEIPKPKYAMDINDSSGTSRVTVLVEHGKTYTEDIDVSKRTIQTATLYQVGLFPTKLPLITLFFSQQPTATMDFYVKAIDSSKPMTDESASWKISSVVAAVLVYKTPDDVDITSIEYETMEYFVIPTSATSEASYQITSVLQDATPLDFDSAFYGSVAAKRVRLFGLTHPEPVPLVLTLTTEPTTTESVHLDGRKRNVIGCFYLVHRDEHGLSSYRHQYHQVILDSNVETKVQIVCPIKKTGFYYAALYSLYEMQFLVEYNHMLLPLDASGETNSALDDRPKSSLDSVPLIDGFMPCYFPGAKIPVQVPHGKNSLRAKIYSLRLQQRTAKMQLQDEAFRTKTMTQMRITDERHKARRHQSMIPIEAARRKSPTRASASAARECELLQEYFAHMAKTQPTFDELRRQEAELAHRATQVEQLADNFETVYADDKEFLKMSEKHKSMRLGAMNDEPPQKDGVFAAEEYRNGADYLETLGRDLYDEVDRANALARHKATSADVEHNLYLAMARHQFLSTGDVQELRDSLVENGQLKEKFQPWKPERASAAIIMPKTYLSAKLPWQPMWQTPPTQPDPLIHHSPKKPHHGIHDAAGGTKLPSPVKSSPTKPIPIHNTKEDQVLPVCKPTPPPPRANKTAPDASVVTTILMRRQLVDHENTTMALSPSDPHLREPSLQGTRPHRPSTAAPGLPTQVSTEPDTAMAEKTTTTGGHEDTTLSLDQSPPPLSETFRKRKQPKKVALQLPWSRLQKDEAKPAPPAITFAPAVNQVTDDVVRVREVPYHVVRHHNKVVAMEEENGRVLLHHDATIAASRSKKTCSSKKGTDKEARRRTKMDGLRVAKVLGNERMALVWAQIADDFAWAAEENPPT